RADPAMVADVVKSWLAENPPAAGKDGRDAEPVSYAQIAKAVESHIARHPPAAGRDGRDGLPGVQGEKGMDGRDGQNGRDGVDGLSLDDFELGQSEDGRSMTLCLQAGDRKIERSIVLPVLIDRGVHKATAEYARGDVVTFQGSLWIAQKDAPTSKPGTDESWRLAVKRGRDGNDGKPGER